MVLVVTSGGAGRRDKQIGHAIARASVALAEGCPASPTAPLKRALSAIMDRAAGSIPRPKPCDRRCPARGCRLVRDSSTTCVHSRAYREPLTYSPPRCPLPRVTEKTR